MQVYRLFRQPRIRGLRHGSGSAASLGFLLFVPSAPHQGIETHECPELGPTGPFVPSAPHQAIETDAVHLAVIREGFVPSAPHQR